MSNIILKVLYLCVICLLADTNIHGSDESLAKGLIAPGENFYGLKWSTDIEGVISKFGSPDAIIRLRDDENKLRTNKKMLLYGRKNLFFFSNDKIYKIYLGFNWLPFEFTDMLKTHKLDTVKWDISNLLKEGMSEKTIKENLGEKLQGSKRPLHYYVDINNYVVFLTFADGVIPHQLVRCSIFQDKQDQLMRLNLQKYSAQKLIDEKNILGVPYGSSRAEVVKFMKEPQGEFNFVNNCTGLLYGKYIFIFKDGLLNGIYIYNNNGINFFSIEKRCSHCRNGVSLELIVAAV